MRNVQAIFKPSAPGDFDGWHRTSIGATLPSITTSSVHGAQDVDTAAPAERVAYLLNLQLGMDLVPPTVYRRDLILEDQSFPQDGAMIYFVDNLQDLMDIDEREWGTSKEALLSDTRILV